MSSGKTVISGATIVNEDEIFIGDVFLNSGFIEQIIRKKDNPNYNGYEIMDASGSFYKEIVETIHAKNLSFVNFTSLKADVKQEPSKVDFVFEPTGNDVPKFLKICIELINLLKDNNSLADLEKEYLYRFYNLFLELETLENTYHFIADLNTLHHFYSSLLRNEKLFFKGEPLN